MLPNSPFDLGFNSRIQELNALVMNPSNLAIRLAVYSYPWPRVTA